jgi:hypothetical protein
MTGIEGVGWPIGPRAVSRTRAKSGFALPPEPAGTDHTTAAAVAQATPLASMLALQELGGETLADQKARRHGHDMLAALAEMQRILLDGGAEAAAPHRLAALAASVPRATDPRLAAIVSAIVLRARVELARRQA